MKNINFRFILINFAFAFVSASMFSQKTDVEKITVFSSRIHDPITFDVKSDTNNIYFNVKNKSSFPYILEINFTECKNLSPQVFYKKVIALPGPNRLFTFRIIDKYAATGLQYETKSYLAKTEYSGDRFNQYLIPVGENKTVKQFPAAGGDSEKIFADQFIMNDGDTVFCARKGIVTATPGTRDDIDRIRSNSYEILHDDGSIAVYSGLDPETRMVTMGEKVFPGQPIGVLKNSIFLTFTVYEILDDGKLLPVNVFYSVSDKKSISQYSINGIKVVFPREVITREMNKREISKYNKNNLF